MKYREFLKEKQIVHHDLGFAVRLDELNKSLFDWQKVLVRWALIKGRAALFEGCGLGKTIQQLEWALQIFKREDSPILILAPLAVSEQTKREGEKFGIEVNICGSQRDVKRGINITNYEKLHKFIPGEFVGVVLDESSILKSFSGKTRNALIESFRRTPYRLACTATPAPNDYIELGNHSEFLGVMSRAEMLSTFFINDTGDTGKWRLKGHVEDNVFWKWLCSWAVLIDKPSDIGFEDGEFILPPLKYHEHIVKSREKPKGKFFLMNATDLRDRRRIRRNTIGLRTDEAAKLINKTDDMWVCWCNLNAESEAMVKKVNGAVEVAGKHSDEVKAERMVAFSRGKVKRLVTKPKIAGFGMNWQICNKAAFVGLSDSWEQFYQAVRRIWRFGQRKQVDIHIFIEERERSVLRNVQKKERQAELMKRGVIRYIKDLMKKEVSKSKRLWEEYNPEIPMELPKWIL